MAPAVSQPARIASLDGVRGLAILGVLLAHAWTGSSAMGVLGVDLFFVLSGFLITGILLKSRNTPQYFRLFYSRRALRLFPVAGVYLAVVAALPLVYALAHLHIPTYQGSWWWYVLYFANLKPGNAAGDPMLGHFWSLAVEEQFYLVWPGIVLLLTPRRLLHVCIAVALGSLALRTWWMMSGADPVMVYRHTLGRIDAMAIGAAVMVAVRLGKKLPLWPAVAAAAMWCGCALVLGYSESALWVRTLGQTLAQVAFAGLVLYADQRRDGWLSIAPLTRLGSYSYCLYVIHVAVIFHVGWLWAYAARQGIVAADSAIPGAVAILISVAVAALSWRYFEGPIEAWKKAHLTSRTEDSSRLSGRNQPFAAPVSESLPSAVNPDRHRATATT